MAFDTHASCTQTCPAPPPAKGQFSGPNRLGHRWFVPEYKQHPSNLWDLAKVVRDRMLAERDFDSRGVPAEDQIREGIRSHPCNARFSPGKPMFLPRFGADRCDPQRRGPYYGVIYIPFRFERKLTPDPTPNKPKPRRRGKKTKGKTQPSGGNRIKAPTLQDCKGRQRMILQRWNMARLLSLNMLQRFKRLDAMSKSARIQAWDSGHELTYFGRYSDTHFNHVWRRIRMTNNALLGQRLTIVCDTTGSHKSCTGHGAYARPARKTMVLCKTWLSARDICWQVGLIIHEAAHLAWVLNSRHKQKYGEGKAKELARRSPLLARRNADNYAYYALKDRCTHVGP